MRRAGGWRPGWGRRPGRGAATGPWGGGRAVGGAWAVGRRPGRGRAPGLWGGGRAVGGWCEAAVRRARQRAGRGSGGGNAVHCSPRQALASRRGRPVQPMKVPLYRFLSVRRHFHWFRRAQSGPVRVAAGATGASGSGWVRLLDQGNRRRRKAARILGPVGVNRAAPGRVAMRPSHLTIVAGRGLVISPGTGVIRIRHAY